MNKVNLAHQKHDIKVGDICANSEPTIIEDSLFYEDGNLLGFYIKDVSRYNSKLSQLISISNKEFRSDNVPKQVMSRGPQGTKADKLQRQKDGKNLVTQFSTILGSVAPKPHMRRPYPTISSVHQVKSARVFIKAMFLACKEAESLIRQLMPEQYTQQKQIIGDNVPANFKFSELFTSSISNFNISAPFHRDNGNLIGCCNAIITKKKNATGGNLCIPDYGVTIDSRENSLLVYPAWKNIHGVTPIQKTQKDGYRNSLIFYPLKSFKPYMDKVDA